MNASFASWLHPLRSFHTTLNAQFLSSAPSTSLTSQNCSLFLLLNLTPHIFVDPYELAGHAHTYTFIQCGTTDLELPVTALPPSGSAVLLKISLEAARRANFTIQVPLHLRYLEPGSTSPYRHTEVPPPIVFWACPLSTGDNAVRGVSDPWLPHMQCEISSLLDPTFSAALVLPRVNISTTQVIQVPLGLVDHLEIVEVGTSLVILLTFVYVLLASSTAASRLVYQATKRD